jgi:chaperonin cofactor prefoldin
MVRPLSTAYPLVSKDYQLLAKFQIPELEEVVTSYVDSIKTIENMHLEKYKELVEIDKALAEIESLDYSSMDPVRQLQLGESKEMLLNRRRECLQMLDHLAAESDRLTTQYVRMRSLIINRFRQELDSLL